MNHKETASLLAALAARQAGERHESLGYDQGTAPVELSIGYIAKTGIVMHDGIVIKSAPPAIIDAVRKWLSDEAREEESLSTICMEAGSGGILIR